MPWFKVDDAAHSHPKMVRAGNAALGLWMRCGSYAAKYGTQGIVAGSIARDFGTPPQAAKLVQAGLWHEPGHDCARCPQPGLDEYVMHDFFEDGRNATRDQVEANREAAAERQRRRRAKKNPIVSEDETDPETIRFAPPFSESPAGQGDVSRRESHDPSQAMPVTPTESQQEASQRAPSRFVEIPDWAMPLVHRIQTALPGLMWKLTPHDWLIVHALIKAKGIDAMADFASRAAGRPGRPVASARYFLDGWNELPAAPPAGMTAPQSAGHRRPGPDDRAAGIQALKHTPDQPLRIVRGEIA